MPNSETTGKNINNQLERVEDLSPDDKKDLGDIEETKQITDKRVVIDNQRRFFLQNALLNLKIFIVYSDKKVLNISLDSFLEISKIYNRFSLYRSIIQFSRTILSGLVFLVFIADFIFEINNSLQSTTNYTVSLLICLSAFGIILFILWFTLSSIQKKHRNMVIQILINQGFKI